MQSFGFDPEGNVRTDGGGAAYSGDITQKNGIDLSVAAGAANLSTDGSYLYGYGPSLTLRSGAANITNAANYGGDLTIRAGSAGNAGTISTGGFLSMAGGDAAAGRGGDVQIVGGADISGTTSRGGNLTLAGGPGDTHGSVILVGLPTSDPGIANALWNDTGTVKISAG